MNFFVQKNYESVGKIFVCMNRICKKDDDKSI